MATRFQQVWAWLHHPTSVLPLAIFRLGFGVLMFASTLRFMLNGWVYDLYIAPQFHFTYYGFSWVRPLPADAMYAAFAALLILSICIALGLFYRVSIVAFFLMFTYIELIDKTYYLNHYYFISVLSFLLIFLPLNAQYALDNRLKIRKPSAIVPFWTILVIQLQLAIVYFFAGVAKLNGDWLFHAQPLRVWLRANTDFPIIGPLFLTTWFPYAMSWVGAMYDLTIAGWLWWQRSRLVAYVAVVVFHGMTAALFNIGVFPWVMIVCTLIFFSARDYAAILTLFRSKKKHDAFKASTANVTSASLSRVSMVLVAAVLLLQFLLPWRHWLYPGQTGWTQEAFRFSWRVMLVESSGYILFEVHDPQSGKQWTIYPHNYLTSFQEKQMAFQPDMILEFAHYIEKIFRAQGYADVEVRAATYVRFNGRASRPLIDPQVDLTQYHASLWPQPWILRDAVGD